MPSKLWKGKAGGLACKVGLRGHSMDLETVGGGGHSRSGAGQADAAFIRGPSADDGNNRGALQWQRWGLQAVAVDPSPPFPH